MEINRRKITMMLVIGALFLVPLNLTAQAEGKDQDMEARVLLTKLSPPIYPPLARQARVSGDVHLKVSVHSDGRIDSVTATDGPPMLRQAALDSARQSHFDCEHCEGSVLVERTFTYSFQISGQEPVDSSCCLEERTPADKPPITPVSQSDNHITITTPAICGCSDQILETLMDRRMRVLAGKDALDCGRVKLDGDPRASLRCARRAISKRRAFFVRFESASMDSSSADGFAGDSSGNIYSIDFDSMGIGPFEGAEIMDNGHDAVQRCPKPVRIKKELGRKGMLLGYRCTQKKKQE